MQINPYWLRTGKGNPYSQAQISLPTDLQIGENALFSEVADKYLMTLWVGESRTAITGKAATWFRPDAKGRAAAALWVEMHLDDWFSGVPDARVNELVNSISSSAEAALGHQRKETTVEREKRRAEYALERHRIQLRCARIDGGKENSKIELTDASILSKTLPVKTQLPGLLERLKKATATPGKKTELAGFLKAPLASVSRWLSGEREPGGEVTLQLLHWVERQERQT